MIKLIPLTMLLAVLGACAAGELDDPSFERFEYDDAVVFAEDLGDAVAVEVFAGDGQLALALELTRAELEATMPATPTLVAAARIGHARYRLEHVPYVEVWCGSYEDSHGIYLVCTDGKVCVWDNDGWSECVHV